MTTTKAMTLTKNISFSALIIAAGVLLPQVMHLIGGKTAGGILLPMHFTVLLSGFLLKRWWSVACGVTIPLLSFVMTAMPPLMLLPFLLTELFILGVSVPFFYGKLKLPMALSLVIAIALGRIAYFASLFIGMNLFGLRLPGNVSSLLAFADTLVTGLPGNALQLFLIPTLFFALKKGGLLHD